MFLPLVKQPSGKSVSSWLAPCSIISREGAWALELVRSGGIHVLRQSLWTLVYSFSIMRRIHGCGSRRNWCIKKCFMICTCSFHVQVPVLSSSQNPSSSFWGHVSAEGPMEPFCRALSLKYRGPAPVESGVLKGRQLRWSGYDRIKDIKSG